jgi:hypothetical protein
MDRYIYLDSDREKSPLEDPIREVKLVEDGKILLKRDLEKSSRKMSQGQLRVEEYLVEACQVSGKEGLEKLDGKEPLLSRNKQGSSEEESDKHQSPLEDPLREELAGPELVDLVGDGRCMLQGKKSSKEISQGKPRVVKRLVEACQVSGKEGLENLDRKEPHLSRTEQRSSEEESDEQLYKKLDGRVDPEDLVEKDLEILESEVEEEMLDRILSDRDHQVMDMKRECMIMDGTITSPVLQLLRDPGDDHMRSNKDHALELPPPEPPPRSGDGCKNHYDDKVMEEEDVSTQRLSNIPSTLQELKQEESFIKPVAIIQRGGRWG